MAPGITLMDYGRGTIKGRDSKNVQQMSHLLPLAFSCPTVYIASDLLQWLDINYFMYPLTTPQLTLSKTDTFGAGTKKSMLERCRSYKESNKTSKERQGPTVGVSFTDVSVKRESTVHSLRMPYL